MNNMEITYMVMILILMSSDHFNECADYVKNVDMQPSERVFMENVIRVARDKRQKYDFKDRRGFCSKISKRKGVRPATKNGITYAETPDTMKV